jgi:pectate lyase
LRPTLSVWKLPSPSPLSPGAEGYGAASVGGRGGRVTEVTNLNDSGTDSLRACAEASGPRTCVFRTGGTITLTNRLWIRNPFLTIAGQTAPGGGIQIRGDAITIANTHDVIIRYIRHRRGPGGDGKGIQVGAGSYDVIIDHSSFGWQDDDNDAWGNVRNVTFQWNIFAEASKGLLVGAPPGRGQEMGSISIHHNYIASNFARNPLITGDGPTEVVNNVIYNWKAFGTEIQNRGAGTAVNFIGDYYKRGPDTNTRFEVLVTTTRPVPAGCYEQRPQMVYMRDNIGPHRTSSAQPEWAVVGYYGSGTSPASPSFQRSSPWPPSAHPITVSPAQSNLANVLSGVGATLPARDAVDTRLVAEYHAGTGSIGGDNKWPTLAVGTPPADTDHDGMPDAWETSKGFDPNNAVDRNTAAPSNSGHTNLEVYLAGTGATLPAPPRGSPPPRPIPTGPHDGKAQ